MAQAQGYDPTSSTPYQAYVPPEPAPPPPPTVAEQTPGYQFTGAPISKAGAIAGVLDNVFRGYMRGKQEAAQKVAMQFKARTDNLHASYEQDAQRLYALAQAGTDPNSDEYKKAVQAVNGSWSALNEWQDKVVNGPDGNKTKKKKKTDQGSQDQPQTPQQQQQQLMQDLQSPDPKVKAAAALKLRQTLGPPVLWQVKQFQTPDAIAARQAQSGQVQHAQAVTQAQGVVDKLGPSVAGFIDTPQSQWTDAQKEQYAQYRQAYDTVNPPKIPVPKPGDETKVALDNLVGKIASDPNYKLTDADRDIFRANKINIDPKSKLHVTSRGEIISEHEDGSFEVLRGPQKAYEPRGAAGGAGSEDKAYAKWDAYYKEHYPNMAADERDALVRHKVEGASQEQTGVIAHEAIAEPKQFDNDVLSAAIDRMRALPQYKSMTSFDDALANLVGQGDNGYQYHARADLGQPDKSGKYLGDVTADQLKNMERDLQTQIRTVLSGPKETALTPEARRAAVSRMAPLFGPAAPAGRGTPAGSPPAQAAPPAASPSSAAPQGGQSQFMATANPKGLKEPGNLPIWNRPTVQNADGSHSSEYSTSFRDPKTGYEVLVPTIVDGKFLTPDGKKPRPGSPAERAMFKAAWDHYLKTGENLGKFDSPASADAYANALHNRGNGNSGGQKPSKGEVWKSDFLRENKGATDADWAAMKTQLKAEGYDPVDK